MTYTIKEVAEKMGVSIATLRYYDKEGLLPFIDKKENGTRVFKDEDFLGLNVINCMKNSGMSIKEIKYYIELCNKGNESLQERLEIFIARKESVLQQIEELNKTLSTIEMKVDYYKDLISAGKSDEHEIHLHGKISD